MPYTDIFLVYDLLGAAIGRGQLDLAHYVAEGNYTHSTILSCLGMLWREGLINAPIAECVAGGDSVIQFVHGASQDGRDMHRLLRETLLICPSLAKAAAAEPAAARAGASHAVC